MLCELHTVKNDPRRQSTIHVNFCFRQNVPQTEHSAFVTNLHEGIRYGDLIAAFAKHLIAINNIRFVRDEGTSNITGCFISIQTEADLSEAIELSGRIHVVESEEPLQISMADRNQ